MPDSAEKEWLAKYKAKYGTSKLGHRKCKFGLAKSKCLKVAEEKQFKGLMCRACLKVKQAEYYQQRKESAE
jgi:hypothetical protein